MGLENLPLVVVASSPGAGKEFAEVARLDNYRVVTDVNKAQGLRTRGVIITQGYWAKVHRAQWEAEAVYDAVNQSSLMESTPKG